MAIGRFDVYDAYAAGLESLAPSLGDVIHHGQFTKDNYRDSKLLRRGGQELSGVTLEFGPSPERPENPDAQGIGELGFNLVRVEIITRVMLEFRTQRSSDQLASFRKLYQMVEQIAGWLRLNPSFGLDDGFVWHEYLQVPSSQALESYDDIGSVHALPCFVTGIIRVEVPPC